MAPTLALFLSVVAVGIGPLAVLEGPQAPCPPGPVEPASYGAPPDSVQWGIDAGRATEDRDAQKCWYALAEAVAREEAAAAPESLDAQYRFALTLGLRADVEGGRTRVGLANELYGQLQTVLEMDPDHADAQHIFGRLHAGVMRMNRVTRFLATRLLGGDALKGASWEEAERLLASAAQSRPDVPDYHYELGRLFEDTDRPELAAEEARHVLALEPRDAGEELMRQRAQALMERNEEGKDGR
jgi:tetratricopeptide (TPR) repeat protein